jgi:hypothetical protein
VVDLLIAIMVIMLKRKYCINNSIRSKCPFSRRQGENVSCTIFFIAPGGQSSIMNNVKMNKHKMIVEGRTSKNTVSSYPQMKTVGAKGRQLAAQEAALAFHTAVYSCSFKSMDITAAIIKTLFNQ